MKVKELIEKLQKQDLEDEIHIWVDQDVGHTSDEHSMYYARNIIIIGHDTQYRNDDNILSKSDIIQNIVDENDTEQIDIEDELIKELNKRYKLKGCWITIQP